MGSPNDLSRVRAIYEEAREQPIDERAKFLDEACGGDAELLEEVKLLLDCEQQSDATFLGLTKLGESAPEVSGLLPPGTRVGPFSIIDQIGKGGMGEVYLASRESDYFANVAIKIATRSSQDAIDRFRRERQILASLDHPNVCRIFDGGSLPHDGRPYLVMEYVKGTYLHEYCERRQLDFQDRTKLVIAICDAVQACHDRGVIHRDLSPNNILVTEDGTAKVMDFGIAGLRKADEVWPHPLEPLTQQTGVGATIPYASPEQVFYSPEKPVDERSDVYMIGTLMYRVLVGQPPFDGKPRSDQVEAILHHDPIAPRKLRKNLPLDLETVCLKCIDKSPNSRYSAVSEVADDLRRYLNHEPIMARRSNLVERTVRWCQRSPLLATALAVLVTVTIAGTTGIAFSLARARAFQVSSQQFLGSLTTSLQESYYLKKSDFKFATDYREELAKEFLNYAKDTVSTVRESSSTRTLLAGIHAELGRQALNENEVERGTNHYMTSLRLWRQALRDNPKSKTIPRAFAMTLDTFASATSGGVKPYRHLEQCGLVQGFRFDNAIDRQLAVAIADFWIHRSENYKTASAHVPVLDAIDTAVTISQELHEAVPSEASYTRQLAQAYLAYGDNLYAWRGNLAAAHVSYELSRDAFAELSHSVDLTILELRDMTHAVWQCGRIDMEIPKWQQGIIMYEEALTLARECQIASRNTIDDVRLETDILWACIQTMPAEVPEAMRATYWVRLIRHVGELMNCELATGNDLARRGYCQFLIASTAQKEGELEGVDDLYVKARRNLNRGIAADEVEGKVWVVPFMECCIALGDLQSSTTPNRQEEYYKETIDFANNYAGKDPALLRVLELSATAKQKMDALKNRSATASAAAASP
ncbi:MAG: serine/threonine-protein kinase [Pirellulales bacterium]